MSKRTIKSVFGVLLIGGVVAYGCSDIGSPVEPLQSPQIRVGGPYLSLSAESDTVSVLRRVTPLAANIEATAVIGSAGGVVEIPQAGLKITVPAGALSVPTPVTVTALAGDLVAYTFQPHGTQFAQVVTGEQSLLGTEGVFGGVDERGYFSSLDAIDWQSGNAVVSEISLVMPEVTSTSIRFFLNHFSGYLLAVDRKPNP